MKGPEGIQKSIFDIFPGEAEMQKDFMILFFRIRFVQKSNVPYIFDGIEQIKRRWIQVLQTENNGHGNNYFL